jgi:hypothetical protein
MSPLRPSVFEDDGADIDLSAFKPKSASAPAPSPEVVREISEAGGFPSRAPRREQEGEGARPSRGPAPELPVQRVAEAPRNLAKTGRTVLLNARITQRAHDRFHAIVAAERVRYETGELTHRVTLGEVVELALAALEREMEQRGRAQ